MRLRIDPWDPEYGASVELDEALEPPAGLDLEVEESGDWAPVASGVLAELPCCSFIDGVRRIEARLFAEDGVAEVPGSRVRGRLGQRGQPARRGSTRSSLVASW